jgi:hypothetical protein
VESSSQYSCVQWILSVFLWVRLFQQAERQVEPRIGMQLDEVGFSVEIGGKGEIKLVAGGEVSRKGAIKLKFKRSASYYSHLFRN